MDSNWFITQKNNARLIDSDIAKLHGSNGSHGSAVSKIIAGKQRMTPEWAAAFAQAFGVPIAEVFERAGVFLPQVAQQLQPGFAESDVAPFVAGPSLGATNAIKTTAESLGGGKPGIDVWTVKGRTMLLAGLLPGDHMLVDQHQAERVKPGDIVIAQVYNRTGATTVLRRFEPPVLLSASVDAEDQRVHVVDGENVVIRGKVIASWRS